MTASPTRTRVARPRALRRPAAVLIPLATTAALALAPNAHAAGWQTPQDLTTTDRDGLAAQVAVAADGTALAVWVRSTDDAIGAAVVETATRPRGGRWSAPRAVSADDGQRVAEPQIAVNDAGDAAVTWLESRDGTTKTNSARVATRDHEDGSWSAPATVSTAGTVADDARVAVDGSGRATVAWTIPAETATGGSGATLLTASRTATGSWRRTAVVDAGRSNLGYPDLAVDATGNATIAWIQRDAEYAVHAASRPAGTTSWGTDELLSTVDGYSLFPKVATGPGGRASVVWATRIPDPQYALYEVQLADRPAADAAFGAFSVISAPGGRPNLFGNSNSPVIDTDASGATTVAWIRGERRPLTGGGDERIDTIQAATRPAGGGFGPIADLAEEPTNVQRAVALGVGDGGHATVLWPGYVDATKAKKIVRAASRTGSGWAPALTLSRPGGPLGSGLTWTPQVAVAPSGDATAIWDIDDPTAAKVVQASEQPVDRPTPVVPDPAAPAPGPVAPPIAPAPLVAVPGATPKAPSGGAAARVRLARTALTADRRGRTTVSVGCPAGDSCRVRVSVRRSGRLLVRRTVTVTAGRTRSVAFTAPASVRPSLARGATVRLRVSLAQSDRGRSVTTTRTLTLRRAR